MVERQPRPGDLLVASVLLADGIFNRSVVLVLDSDEDGALGVILNEISQTRLDAVLPDWVAAVSRPQLLFHGGPVSPNGAICLASVRRRSGWACGTSSPPTTPTCPATSRSTYGVGCCGASGARWPCSPPGSRTPT